MTLNEAYFRERTRCPVCAGSSSEEVYRSPLSEPPIRLMIEDHYKEQGTVNWPLICGTDYVVLQCNNCKLIYQKYVPNDDVLEDLYSRWISKEGLTRFEHGMLTTPNFRQIAGELEYLFHMTGKKAGDISLLDYGFGHGRWARVARGMGARVFATEIGDDKPVLAATLGVEMIQDQDIDGMKFDIVHTEQVFEHLVDPAETFKRLARATNSIFKIAVPRHSNAPNLLRTKGMATSSPLNKLLAGHRLSREDETYLALLPLEHLNLYPRETVEYLASTNGLTIVSGKRRRTLTIDTTSAGNVLRSLAKGLGTAVVKEIRPRTGEYWVMQPVSN
jgi:hypothetical protein